MLGMRAKEVGIKGIQANEKVQDYTHQKVPISGEGWEWGGGCHRRLSSFMLMHFFRAV